MDQRKIGKFIAECRKNKGLTQEELGTKLGVSDKAVSKWERGINAPDISVLESLSKELGISINELLKGEHLKCANKDYSNDDIATIKFYINAFKNKSIDIKLVIVFTILILIFSLAFTISNYNRVHVYSLKSEDESLSLDGYFIFNPEEKIIIITKIYYNDENIGTNLEEKSETIEISLISNDKIIFTSNINYDSMSLKPISEILNDFSVNIIDRDNDNFYLNDLNSLYLCLKYENENQENKLLKFKILTNENFSNNKFFY